MDRRKDNAVKAQGAVDQTTSVSTDPEVCPQCGHRFKSYAGRRLHQRLAHEEDFHVGAQALNEKKSKRRWTDEERFLVAEAEVGYTGTKAGLYAHLCEALPSRSLESIKGLRNKNPAVYQQFVQRARERLSVPSAPLVADGKVGDEWTDDERRLLAEAEAQYRGSRSKLVEQLCMVLPSHDKASVRKQRRTRLYKEELQAVKDRLETCHSDLSTVPPAATERVRLCSIPEIAEDLPHAEPMPEDEGLGETLPRWKASLKNLILKAKVTQAHTCISNRNRTDRLFAKWLSKFTPDITGKEIHRAAPEIKGNRAQRRRKLRAAWLDAYERNPSRTAKLVLDGQQLHDRSTLPEGTPAFWKELYETESTQWIDRVNAKPKETTIHQSLLRPFTRSEIEMHVKSMKDGAAGCDNIKKKHLQKMDYAELAEWFNLFLLQGMLPRCLKRFRTTLIPKKPNPTKPGEYRPISVGSFVRRVYCGLWAKRMRAVETHWAQKGFKQVEGCAIQSYTLRAIVDDHIKRKRPLSYAFMDVRKAFDSVSHHALRKAYIKADLPAGLITLLEDMYVGNTTLLSADPQRNLIHLRQGVLQGDPLSPVLFNLVMDDVISGIGSTYGATFEDSRVNTLLFADDAVLLAETTEGLQKNISTFVERMAVYGLRVNAQKCAAVHIHVDGKRKRWYVASEIPLRAGNEPIKALTIGESYKYLGLQLQVNKGRTTAEDSLKRMLGRVSTSVLKPQHKLDILKKNIIPKILFETGLEFRSDCLLNDLDIRVRKEIRRWLHLPKDVPVPLFHAEVADGGLGVPSLRARVPRLQQDRFDRTDKAENPDPFVQSLRNSAYWARQKNNTQRSLERIGIISKSSEKDHWRKRLYTSVDGSGLRSHSNNSGYKSRWLSDPGSIKLSGREFIGAVHARSNCLYTRERATRGRMTDKGRNCPCCPDKRESLAHILQVCWRSQNHRIFRHNKILMTVSNKLKKIGHDVIREPRITVGKSFLKPDMVVHDTKKKAVVIIDPTIVATSRDLVLAEKDKVDKYNVPEVVAWATAKYGDCEVGVLGMAMDWRGAWAPRSWTAMKALRCNTGFLDTLSFKVLKLNKWIHSCIRNRTDA